MIDLENRLFGLINKLQDDRYSLFLDKFIDQNKHLVSLFCDTLNHEFIKWENKMPIKEKYHLKNGQVGEEYLWDFFKETQKALATVEEVQLPEDIGLVWDKETGCISGKPTKAGIFEVAFKPTKTDLIHKCTLLIHPDPRSLWNNIPTNQNVRFYKPDSANELVETPFGQIIAARQRGRSHAHHGIACDDDFRIAYHEDTKAHLLAVSDGAGSAEYSRQGSKLAVDSAIENMLGHLSNAEKSYKDLSVKTDGDFLDAVIKHLLYYAIESAYKSQIQFAQQENILPKSLSSTLLCAFSMPLINDKWLTAAYWVGDGAVALWLPEKNEVELLGEVDSGEYSGETRFLNADEAKWTKIEARLRYKITDEIPFLFLMTDGVSDPKFENDMALKQPESWKRFWDEISPELKKENPSQHLEDWLNFWSKGEHDDRTLALFVPNTYLKEDLKDVDVMKREGIFSIKEDSIFNMESLSENNHDMDKLVIQPTQEMNALQEKTLEKAESDIASSSSLSFEKPSLESSQDNHNISMLSESSEKPMQEQLIIEDKSLNHE